MLYTITFKSGAQQLFELDKESVRRLAEGFKAVHEGQQKGVLTHPDASASILLEEVASFGPYVSMARRYGTHSK